MEKPILIKSTDWHIHNFNTGSIISLVNQQCKLAVEKDVKYIACLGDVFESRKAQPLHVLKTFEDILSIIEGYKLKLLLLPGNHDKVDYSSYQSYLDIYRNFDVIELFADKYKRINIEGIYLHMIPFLSNDIWMEEFNKVDLSGEGVNILLSHIAVEGSVNNDGSKVESSLTPSLFKNFHKVFLGHYHNAHKIGENIYHIPSIQQNDYGEDSDKGFTVLYSDGTHELIKSQFKEFEVVEVDLSIATKKDIDNAVMQFANREDINVRFKFIGDKSQLKKIESEKLKGLGIDVKRMEKDIDIIDINFKEENVIYTETSIVGEFKNFCEENKKDYNKGVNYLK